MKVFRDKVAAITGAASGMGRALALDLAREGCHLALSDCNAHALAQTVAEVGRVASRSAPMLRVTSAIVDVSQRDTVHAWADETAAAHGYVNLIFNNAGVALSSTVEGMSYDDLDWIIGINFWGVVHGTKAFLPHLQASGEGHVINTSSVFGLFAQPGMGAYNASKYAVRGFTEALRQELDLMNCGVSATTVHPGGIKTNIARASRVSPSVNGLLVRDAQQGREEFEKFFITSPEKAARVILEGVRANRRRVLIGPDAVAADAMARLLPAAYQSLVVRDARRKRRKLLGNGASAPAHDGERA
ncbi:SDR family NAD(P)-dependent oxidoreductase [Cupriavidus pampae]|uniref:Oxidoreductase SadH n=1 Tax=Cupriavidus pampae TaxID=659251 RepID=A0ABM8X5X2_9BURK|nr:SDR family NAD(P)-dependent oxidoreductase [Cupriavidus pampae]CAG9175351.1 Putative oxidoreductase SadH [Cupriavidus pampae]